MEPTQILFMSKERSRPDLAGSSSEVRTWQWETVSSGWEALERVQEGSGPDLVMNPPNPSQLSCGSGGSPGERSLDKR
jgi:hypothetical protein